MSDPSRSQTLNEYVRTYQRYFYHPDRTMLDVIWGCYYANQLSGPPVWLYIAAPPSYGKTSPLDFMLDHSAVMAVDVLTGSGFLSGYTGEETKHGRKRPKYRGVEMPNASALPTWNGKLVVMADMTSVLGLPVAQLRKLLGELRRAYDGRVAFKSGVDVEPQHYKAKFGLIAAVTDAIDNHREMLADLGERFMLYRLPTMTLDHQRRAIAFLSERDESAMAQEMTAVSGKMLDRHPPEAGITQDLGDRMVAVAHAAALGRTTVRRQSKSRRLEAVVRPEACMRLYGQMSKLAKGIAMAKGRRAVAPADVSVVQRLALHTMTLTRFLLLRAVLEAGHEMVTAGGLEGALRLDRETIERHLEDMAAVGLVIWHRTGKERRWHIAQEYLAVLQEVWAADERRAQEWKW